LYCFAISFYFYVANVNVSVIANGIFGTPGITKKYLCFPFPSVPNY